MDNAEHANVKLEAAGSSDYVSRHFHRVTVTVPTPGAPDAPLVTSARVRDWEDARRLANEAYRARGDYAAQVRVLVDHVAEGVAADMARRGWDDGGEYARHTATNDVFGLCPDGCCGGPEEMIESTRDDDPTVIRARFYRAFSREVAA